MNSKYLLKPEFIDCQIHTKTSDGTDILVTKNDFNDYFAEMLLRNGQDHLIMLNPHYDLTEDQKKTFTQVSEGVISLTLAPEQIAKKQQKEIVGLQDLKEKDLKQ